MADIQSNINVNIDTSSALSSIKALQAQISAFHTSMAKGSATAATASSQLQQKLLDSVNATGAFRASIQGVKSTTESFTTSLEKNKFSLGEYFKYSVASTKSFGNAFKTEMNVVEKVARERVKSLQTQYISLGRDANGALKAMSIRPLLLDLDNMQTKTAIAAQKQQILNQLLKQGSTNLLNFGKNTQWAGRQLMVGFTIPLSMAATAAAKAYMDIEKASIKIKRVYGDLNTTAQETDKIVDSIKRLATEYTRYGIAVADTMDMAAKAAAMGKTGADLLAQVNESTRLSALGGVDQAAALETTISLTNAFGTSADQLAAKINFLNAVENQTVTSIEDLTIAIPKAGPVVKQLGGDVEDLTFFLTAMREGGINASEGANALKSGLASLINPTTKASEMLAGFGINIKAIVEGNKGDIKKTVIDFATALNTIDPLNRARAIEQMFGKFQFARISTLLQNVTSSSSQASKAVALANMSSIQLAAMSRKELDRVASSPMYKFQKAIADLQVKIAPVGESFLKAITPIVEWVSKLLEGFNGMSDQFKNFAVIGTAVIGGLAPVLLMVVGLVANGAANIIKLFANIKAFFNKTTTASQILGETTNYLTQEQIQAEAVAASLDQIHTKLKQTFTSEAAAVDTLTAALQRSVDAQKRFAVAGTGGKSGKTAKNLAGGGMVYGPGTKTSDSIPANLSNGEAVIDADTVAKNPAIIAALFAGKKINIPGYANSGIAGNKNIPLYGEYAGRLQDPRENLSRKSSGNVQLMDVLSVLAARVGEARGIVPSQPNVQAGKFDSIVSQYEDLTTRFVTRLNSEYDTTFSNIADTNERYRLSWANAGKHVESELSKVESSVDSGAIRKVFGLDKDFYGTAPTMPRREGGTEVQRGRKGVFKTSETNVRSYTTVLPAAREIAIRATQNIERYGKAQFGHVFDSIKTSFNDLASDPRVGGTIKRIAKTLGVSLPDRFTDELQKSAQTASESKRTKKIAKDTVDGYANELERGKKKVTASAAAAAKLAGIEVGESVAIGARTSRLGPVGATTIPFTPITQSAQYQAGKTTQTTSRVASPFVQDVKASFVNMRSNIQNEMRMISNDTKSVFDQIKNIFRIGGKQAAEASGSGLAQSKPQLVAGGKKLGFDYVAALKGGNGAIAAVITKGNQGIISKALTAYNAGGFKVAGAISLGLEKGIAGSLGRAAVAGRKLAEAEIVGVESVAATQKVKKQKREIVEDDFMGPLKENQVRRSELKGLDTGRIAKFGTAITTATFALSMMPGPIGEFAATLTPIIGLVSGLSAVMSALNVSIVGGQIAMGAFSLPIWPVVAGLAALAGVIWLITASVNAANEAEKRKLQIINNTAKAYDNAGKAVSEFGKLAGVTAGKNVFENAKVALATGTTGKQASDTQLLLESEEFKDPKSAISSLIANVKGMTDTAAKSFLSSYANQLRGYGFDGKTIQAILTAIELKAGKTNLKLKFASIDISSGTGRAQLETGIKEAVSGINVADIAAYKKQKSENTNLAGSRRQLAEAKGFKKDAEKAGMGWLVGGFMDLDINSRKRDLEANSRKGLEKNKNLLKDPKYATANANLKTAVEATKSGVISAFSQFGQGVLNKSGLLAAMTSIEKGLGKGKNASIALNTAIGQLGNKNATKTSNTLIRYGKDASAVGKGFDAAQTQLRYFAILTNSPGIGKTLNAALDVIANDKLKNVQEKAIAAQKEINRIFNQVANNPSLVETAPTTTPDTTGGGGSSPADVLKDLLEANKAAVLNQKLMRQGFGSDFVAMIATADKAVRDYYTDVVKGKVILNSHGQALLKAYNVKVIKDFQIANTLALRNIGLEIAARNYLATAVKNGLMSAAQANEFATRTDVQLMYAQAMATKGAVKRKAAIDAVTEALLRQAKAQDNLAKSEVKGAQETFNEAYEKGTKFLDNQVAKINIEFDMDPTNNANKKAIQDANNAIQDLQTGVNGKIGLDQYNNALSKLQFREDEINKKYDERAKALDKVAKINQKISEQQKGQLSLAAALSQGDIAAAAQAAQEMTAASAAGSIEDQKSALELARQNELDNLTVEINGKKFTRTEIEKASKKIEEEILDIQIKQLAPATTALGLAERNRDANIKNITDQKLAWDNWKLSVDAAALSLGAYIKLIGSMPSIADAATADVISKAGADATTKTPGEEAVSTATKARDAAKTTRDNLQSNIDNFDNPTPANLKKLAQWKVDLAAAQKVLDAAETALTNAIKANTPVKKASGGYISGAGTGTSDSIPALLSNGEYVIKAKSVQSLGKGFLDHVNENGTVFADGGFMNTKGYNDGHANFKKNTIIKDTKLNSKDYLVNPKNPMSAIGQGMKLAMDNIWNGLIGPFANSLLRKGKVTNLSADDAWAASNALPLPIKGGATSKLLSKFVPGSIKNTISDAMTNLAFRKDLRTGIFHGTQSMMGIPMKGYKGFSELLPSTQATSFTAQQRAHNWFGANAFGTTSATLAKEYSKIGPYLDNANITRLAMGKKDVKNIKVLDLMPNSTSLSKRNPKLYNDLQNFVSKTVDPSQVGTIWDTGLNFAKADAKVGRGTNASYSPAHMFLTDHQGLNMGLDQAVARQSELHQILGNYGYNAIKHESGHAVGNGLIKKPVYAFLPGAEGISFVRPGSKVPSGMTGSPAISTSANLLVDGLSNKAKNVVSNTKDVATKLYNYVKPKPKPIIMPERGLAMGGLVTPSYFANGGMARGTDTIPAMLTPGEFVINKFAAADLGINRLNAINSGKGAGLDPASVLNSVASINTSNNNSAITSSAYTDASVYNYTVSVNVKSDANPDQIAQAVMTKINSTNSQRIRGNRF